MSPILNDDILNILIEGDKSLTNLKTKKVFTNITEEINNFHTTVIHLH
jgi:hypothetical protein